MSSRAGRPLDLLLVCGNFIPMHLVNGFLYRLNLEDISPHGNVKKKKKD